MRPNASRAAAALLSLTAGMLFLCSLGAAPPQDGKATAKAKDSAVKPKHKDSSPRFQPKEVTYGTRVAPANAKPGDVVTYSVDVDVDQGFHIYALAAKDAKDDGKPKPEPTKFDLFGMSGLTAEGDWTFDPKPESKLDAAFDNLKVEYFEGHVTFSRKLRIPKDAKPGKYTLRNQIYFQTCDEKKCLPPAYITLPDVDVNVGGSPTTLNDDETRALLGAVLVATKAPAAFGHDDSSIKPKHKDSNPKARSNAVSISARVTPADAKPGEDVIYSAEVRIEDGWHIYGLAAPGAKPSTVPMPEPTRFDFFGTAGFKLDGGWSADPKPESKPYPAFNNARVEYFEGNIEFQHKLRIPKDAKPGKYTLRNQIYFSACNEKSCDPPAYITLPDVDVNVGGSPTTLNDDETRALLSTILVATTPTAPAAAPSPRKVGGDLGKAIDGGLLTFLMYSALGGLVAVLMPCVWPMIPITVNFFVKQGEKSKGGTTALAFGYCAAIIGIFTSVGLGVTLIRGGSGASDLGNNPWMNLFMGIAFIALGASLLGLFELRLPTAFLNFSSQGEGKGGIAGVMFMALTLTLTSFTCTAPVVGALLGEASRGRWFYPALGMLTFSSVLALPFFLLALMPGLMKKMPRSGDWMNAVKVVGGLIEIGAAFKFLNTAEISFGTSPANAWFNASFVLTAWVVVAMVCGVYLLGLFRTDHDHDAVRVGPTRMLLAMVFLSVGLFLMPALFGVRPPNKLYEAIIGILPPDADRLDNREATINEVRTLIAGLGAPSGERSTVADGGGGPVAAVSTDPKEALLQEKKFHGVVWGLSYDAAIAEAKAKNRPVLIDFTGVNCANCRTVERVIMPKPEVVTELKKFVTVSLYNDFVDIASITKEQREELADENKERQLDLADTIATPVYVVVTPDGKVLGKVEYAPADPDFLLKFLREMQGKFQGVAKVAAK